MIARPAALVVAVVASAVAVVGARAARVASVDHLAAVHRYEDAYYLPPAEVLPALSLGWREALADLVWMRALVYVGDEVGHQGEVAHVFEYADAVLALDPDFRRVYAWIGAVGMYRPREVGVDEVRRSVAYLEAAVRRFPGDGELAWDLGASLVYELAPRVAETDPDEAERVRLAGLEHMQAAARMGAGPPWLALSNAASLERLGRREQAIRHLEEMAAVVDDEVARAQILDRIATLRDEAEADAIREVLRDAERRRLRDFPYVPSTLSLLLGPRPPERVEAPAEPRD